MAEPYRDKPSGTAKSSKMAGDDQDWDSTVDVTEVSGKEVESSSSGADFSGPVGRRLSPVDDLKHRLSLWGESNLQPADSDEEGSEYELLLDPNLPDEYSRPSLPVSRVSSRSDADSEKAVKISSEDDDEEDSPYPEVRAAVHNYDIEAPCNTVSESSGHWSRGLFLTKNPDSRVDNRHDACCHRCLNEHSFLFEESFDRSGRPHRPNYCLAHRPRLGCHHAQKTIHNVWTQVVA